MLDEVSKSKQGHIHEITRKLILDVVDQYSAKELEKKETKMKIIVELYNQRVFDV